MFQKISHKFHDKTVKSNMLWLKGCEFESRQKQRKNFRLQSQLCVLLVGVPSTPVLPQWHVKDTGRSATSADSRLQLNTHTPLSKRSRSGLTMPLFRHSEGTYQETSSHTTRQGTLGQSSQVADPLWTDPGVKSGISVCELISTKKKTKKKRSGRK